MISYSVPPPRPSAQSCHDVAPIEATSEGPCLPSCESWEVSLAVREYDGLLF